MNVVDEYFVKKTDKISFVELRAGSNIRIRDYTIDDDLPLPIIIDTLIGEIQKGNIYEEIKVSHIIDGIIFILGIDTNFKFKEEYVELLYEYEPNIEDYIMYRGLKYIEAKNLEYGAVFFRSLVNINNKNINGIFNYALSLENLSIKFAEKGETEKSIEFLLESTRRLESILDISEDFPLAYYKLGYHYKNYEQFIKAKLIWEKYINMDKDLERIQEIREQIELIDDDADFEEGVVSLSNGEYSQALEKLLGLCSKYKEWGNVFYLTGLAYKGLGDYENAIDYFYEAINLDFQDVNVYNELGICLFALGYANESIDIFNIGIELNHMDYRIIFNRGLVYLQLGDIEKATEDIETAYRLNPNDAAVGEQFNKLNYKKY